jgi:ATP-dependent metalloprotease
MFRVSALLACSGKNVARNVCSSSVRRDVVNRNNKNSVAMVTFGNHRLSPVLLTRRTMTSQQLNDTLSNIQGYLKTNPERAISMIERGWQTKELPMTQQVASMYISAVTAAGRSSSLNYSKLNAAVAAESGMMTGFGSGIGMNSGFLAGFGSQAHPVNHVNQGIGVLAPGSSPHNPIYTNVSETPISFTESMKRGAMKLFLTGMGLCIGYLALDAMGVLPGSSNKSGSGPSSVFGGKLAGLGKGPVRLAEVSTKRFTDVVGVDEAKTELQEIVQYLKDPAKYTRLGATLPRGVLLLGPPGTGKTLLAKAIAGEAGVPFFYAAGSEFEEMFVGVGASRVRELFHTAKARAPCIIFLDEIDAMGGSRNLKDQSAMKMTLNQLLTEMDGFETNPGIIVIGATNFAEALDKALVRPGRFDKHVEVPAPDIGGRLQILELYGSKVPCDDDVDFDQLARGTPGFTGADLYNLVNQAALKAAGDNLHSIGMAAFEYAKDKIMMGAERKTAIISPESMKCTAFHEAGHALVALKTDGADPIHKATIMPRGRALGMVMQLPDGDQVSMSKKQMLARMDVCMGGRVAEELVFGPENVTSGASSDIQQATRLARAMVMKFGLSDKMGCMYIDEKESPVADNTTVAIDSEVRQLLEDSYSRAKKLIHTNRTDLDAIAGGLLNFESLSGREIADIVKGIQPTVAKRSMKPSRELKQVPMTANGAKITAAAANNAAVQAVATNPAATSGTSNNKSKSSPNSFLAGLGVSSSSNATNNDGPTDSLAPPPAQPANPAQQQQPPASRAAAPSSPQAAAAGHHTRGPPKA